MDLVLSRNSFQPTGIFGTLSDAASTFSLCTLEHSFNNLPKIPPGSYTCIRRFSPKFAQEVFMLENVPNTKVDPADGDKEFCDFIEIHIGNTNQDSDGCILLGMSQKGSSIFASRMAYAAFLQCQDGVQTFTLKVE